MAERWADRARLAMAFRNPRRAVVEKACQPAQSRAKSPPKKHHVTPPPIILRSYGCGSRKKTTNFPSEETSSEHAPHRARLGAFSSQALRGASCGGASGSRPFCSPCLSYANATEDNPCP